MHFYFCWLDKFHTMIMTGDDHLRIETIHVNEMLDKPRALGTPAHTSARIVLTSTIIRVKSLH